jgi:cyclopropane fatty-acyl-phospholipid synthase-like methyltransferase
VTTTPNTGQATPERLRHFVTGNSTHPFYGDEARVKHVTEWLLDQGRTVFQLFQLDTDEGLHSRKVLDRLDLPHGAKVLSLGCGVGGMERHWHGVRPDLSFTLVNVSQAQLDACVCPGERVRADMVEYDGCDHQFDCVVLAYALGHVPLKAAIDTAWLALKGGGVLLVLDVVDASQRFNDVLAYDAPSSKQLLRQGLERAFPAGHWHPVPRAVLGDYAADVLSEATPTLWLGKAGPEGFEGLP